MQKDIYPKNLIDLSALIYNVKVIKNLLPKSLFCAVVKSDAYGHGICEVSTTIQKYCDFFAVASISEGVKMRIAGINKPILCLLPDNDFYRAHYYNITVTVQSVGECDNLANFCKSNKVKISFHLAINTGMNRLGINSLCELEQIFNIIKDSGAIFCGAYSHFYNLKNKFETNVQFKKFLKFQSVIKQNFQNAICHISSSGGLFKNGKYNLDMVRVGLAMYGYMPVNGTFTFKKVLKTVCSSLCERSLKKGESLLYGGYKNKLNKKVQILPYGYFNGLRRGLNGQLNTACMNLSAVKSGNGVIMDNAKFTAKQNKTNVYNVLTAFGCGAERVYFYGDKNENNSG